MKRTRHGLAAVLLCILTILGGCGTQSTAEDSSDTETVPSELTATASESAIDTASLFNDRDLAGTYDESEAVTIQLNGDSASCDSDSVVIDGSTVTITAEGVYLLSGALTDGQVIVNAADTDKVQLVLAGADITSSTSAAIYALEADKVFVTLAEGTENTLTNGGEYVAIDDNNIDAVIFAKTDLTLNGAGSLTINAQGDAISAQGALQIDGGTFDLYTGEGSESVEMTNSDQLGQWGGGQRSRGSAPQAETAATDEDSISQKGIKGESAYAINGGTFAIDSADDCLHAGGVMTIVDGTFTLNSGDDAVHCDDALTILNGTFTIPYCYEGIEGLSITIDDGIFDITSHDDGLNAAGGTDSSGFGGFGGRQQDGFSASSDSFITINGGTFTIVSGGDCVDSNGALTINGGTLNLTCNGSGDTAIDCDGTYTNNGGDVTTNDGSENSLGQMGGGMGGRSGTGGQNGVEAPGEIRRSPGA